MTTIFAPATLIGGSGLTVFRVSGEHAFESLKRVTSCTEIIPNKALLKKIKHPKTGVVIDEGLILPFKAPHSFTGEDVVEYHLHGGHAVADAFVDLMGFFDGYRMAEPGEFTKRAFENNKIDLTQAEAIGDLIHAQTEAQRLLAMDQLSGGLKDLYQGWAQRLKKSLAFIEADIDFSDEELPDELSSSMKPILEEVIAQIYMHLNDARQGERLREGIKIAVIGAPNAGKSSLLNKLAQRDIAIVTDIEGTTRDVLEVPLNLAGYPVILADTAGLRETNDVVESEGIRRARKWAEDADIKIVLFDSSKTLDQESLSFIDDKTLICSTKADIHPSHEVIQGEVPIQLSVEDEAMLANFIDIISGHVKDLMKHNNIEHKQAALITRQRHRKQVEEAQECLARALIAPQLDMMAEDVRLAVRALGKITGHVDVEDLLDVIFSEFCIGK